jgi:hypothetical protein
MSLRVGERWCRVDDHGHMGGEPPVLEMMLRFRPIGMVVWPTRILCDRAGSRVMRCGVGRKRVRVALGQPCVCKLKPALLRRPSRSASIEYCPSHWSGRGARSFRILLSPVGSSPVPASPLSAPLVVVGRVTECPGQCQPLAGAGGHSPLRALPGVAALSMSMASSLHGWLRLIGVTSLRTKGPAFRHLGMKIVLSVPYAFLALRRGVGRCSRCRSRSRVRR